MQNGCKSFPRGKTACEPIDVGHGLFISHIPQDEMQQFFPQLSGRLLHIGGYWDGITFESVEQGKFLIMMAIMANWTP